MAAAKRSQFKDSAATNALALDAIAELLHSPRRLFWLNLKTGFIRGFGGVLGAAVAVVLIGILVAIFGGLPYIGGVVKSIEQAVPKN